MATTALLSTTFLTSNTPTLSSSTSSALTTFSSSVATSSPITFAAVSTISTPGKHFVCHRSFNKSSLINHHYCFEKDFKPTVKISKIIYSENITEWQNNLFKSSSTASSIIPNSKACSGFLDLFDVPTSKIYQKSICLIESTVAYSRAVISCGQFGMRIFDIGSPNDARILALNFANFQDTRYTFWVTDSTSSTNCPRIEYSSSKLGWIINTSASCSDASPETFCEFKNRQGKSLNIYNIWKFQVLFCFI